MATHRGRGILNDGRGWLCSLFDEEKKKSKIRFVCNEGFEWSVQASHMIIVVLAATPTSSLNLKTLRTFAYFYSVRSLKRLHSTRVRISHLYICKYIDAKTCPVKDSRLYEGLV
jgi:hypothetical protein